MRVTARRPHGRNRLPLRSLTTDANGQIWVKYLSEDDITIHMKGELVWRKDDLPSSDDQDVEDGTNITGQFRFSQARWENNGERIDQTRYFRYDVFDNLNWQQNDKQEVANARFKILYSGTDLGIRELEIVHNPSWESGQDGVTTHLRWGDMLEEVKENMVLQGKDFELYASTSNSFDFVIDIS